MEVYRQRTEFYDRGMPIKGLLLNKHHYDSLQLYRASLGVMQNQSFEYIKKDSLFGLEFYLDSQIDEPRVF
ncbi:MAG: hypothetical protein A2Z96_00350 [Spirochaetes bacterium GWB1_48_6]|nr:MAG: hypothetical protein A2Z96_00350 [Spirochaetes bacterium GWB1_48_6]